MEAQGIDFCPVLGGAVHRLRRLHECHGEGDFAASCAKQSCRSEHFAKVVFYGPDKRSHAALARKLGFDPRSRFRTRSSTSIGNSGAAALPVMLVAALSEAAPAKGYSWPITAMERTPFVLHVTGRDAEERQHRASAWPGKPISTTNGI